MKTNWIELEREGKQCNNTGSSTVLKTTTVKGFTTMKRHCDPRAPSAGDQKLQRKASHPLLELWGLTWVLGLQLLQTYPQPAQRNRARLFIKACQSPHSFPTALPNISEKQLSNKDHNSYEENAKKVQLISSAAFTYSSPGDCCEGLCC